MDLRKALFGNIVLSGGSTLTRGMLYFDLCESSYLVDKYVAFVAPGHCMCAIMRAIMCAPVPPRQLTVS